jgi:hypothetical protein
MSVATHSAVIARLDRANQYMQSFVLVHGRLRLLDHPVKPGDDSSSFDRSSHHTLKPESI